MPFNHMIDSDDDFDHLADKYVADIGMMYLMEM